MGKTIRMRDSPCQPIPPAPCCNSSAAASAWISPIRWIGGSPRRRRSCCPTMRLFCTGSSKRGILPAAAVARLRVQARQRGAAAAVVLEEARALRAEMGQRRRPCAAARPRRRQPSTVGSPPCRPSRGSFAAVPAMFTICRANPWKSRSGPCSGPSARCSPLGKPAGWASVRPRVAAGSSSTKVPTTPAPGAPAKSAATANAPAAPMRSAFDNFPSTALLRKRESRAACAVLCRLPSSPLAGMTRGPYPRRARC